MPSLRGMRRYRGSADGLGRPGESRRLPQSPPPRASRRGRSAGRPDSPVLLSDQIDRGHVLLPSAPVGGLRASALLDADLDASVFRQLELFRSAGKEIQGPRCDHAEPPVTCTTKLTAPCVGPLRTLGRLKPQRTLGDCDLRYAAGQTDVGLDRRLPSLPRWKS